MKLTLAQFNKIKKLAEKIYKKNNDPFHDFEHALIVSNLAVEIAKKEKADVTVCKISGLLHDLAPKKRGGFHGTKSAFLAKKLLNKMNLDKKFINQVYQAIIHHDSAKSHLIKTREGKVVFEADKLQAYGPMGIIREYGDLFYKGYSSEKARELLIKNIQNYHKRTKFFTKSGKRIKKELIKFHMDFLRLYNKYQKL